MYLSIGNIEKRSRVVKSFDGLHEESTLVAILDLVGNRIAGEVDPPVNGLDRLSIHLAVSNMELGCLSLSRQIPLSLRTLTLDTTLGDLHQWPQSPLRQYLQLFIRAIEAKNESLNLLIQLQQVQYLDNPWPGYTHDTGKFTLRLCLTIVQQLPVSQRFLDGIGVGLYSGSFRGRWWI